MTAIIQQHSYGTAAFLDRQDTGMTIVMNCDQPCVEWSFRIKDLQRCLTTLEEVLCKETVAGNRSDLMAIYCSLQAAMTRHEEEHKAIVTEAPTADDLQAYLSAYAAAAAQGQ